MNAIHHPAVLALAWTLLHFLWQGALLALTAWAGLTLLARRSPQARYAWACGMLGLMALAPVATFLILGRAAASGPTPLPQSLLAALPASPWDRLQATLQPWLPALTLGWMAGVGLFALRLVGGLALIQRMKEAGTSPVPGQWHLILARLGRELKLHRTVRLLGSTKVDVPTVVGWLRPVILLPAAALTQLSPCQLEAILAHELAHVRRHDFAVNLLQACVEALLFYHPAVWWLSAKVREERELACDDVAVTTCGDALAYAQALAVLDEARGPIPTLALASHGGSLMKRIARLIQPQLLPNPTLRSALLAALAATALGAAGLALQEGKEEEKKRSFTVQTLDDGRQLSIKREGDVRVKPDEKEPLTLGAGARIRIADRKDGKSRRLDASPGKKTYTVDGQEKPFDAEAEAWLRDTLKASEKAKGGARPRRIEVEVKEEGGKRHVIKKENGEVLEDTLLEVPEVRVTEEGPGKQRIIVKQGSKIVENRLIEIPEIKVTDEKDGTQRIIVKKGGKVVEDHRVPRPHARAFRTEGKGGRTFTVDSEGGPDFFWESDGFEGPGPFTWKVEGPEGSGFPRMPQPRMSADEVRQLRRQVDQLRRQVEELQRQLGQKAPAPPKPPKAPAPPSVEK